MPRRIKSKHQLVATLDAELLRRVRAHGGLSRMQLARELKLAPSTAGIYVDRLVREGFLLETETTGQAAAGRPATSLVPNPDGGRFIGVDFGVPNLMATVVDFSQRPLRQSHTTLRPADSAARVLAKIEQAIEEMTARDPRPVLGIGVVYNVSPLDAKAIGTLVRDYRVTFLLATPTFLQMYNRGCEPEDFGSLQFVMTGAEKLPDRVAQAFEDKFGIRPLEGSGLT